MKHRRGSVSVRLSMHHPSNTHLAPSINEQLHSLSAVHEESSRSPPINNPSSAQINGDKKSRYELINDHDANDPSTSRSKTLLKSFSPDRETPMKKKPISNEKRSTACTIQ